MKVIGLTGGIGSGKSTISRYIKEKGIPIIDADKISREIVRPGSEGLEKIVEKYGKDYLLEDKSLDRAKLGALVFNDPQKIKELNSILHPIIREKIESEITCFRQEQKYPLIIVDAAILIESEMTDLVDYVWLVYVDLENQLKRITERDGFHHEQAMARINSQMPLKDKKKFADEVIDNSGNLKDTFAQVEDLIKRYNQK